MAQQLAAHFVILKIIRKHYSTWKNLVEWHDGLPDDLSGKDKNRLGSWASTEPKPARAPRLHWTQRQR